MTVLAKTNLTIRDQSELLNQIAGTYKDFYRAAMEYIDNAIDVAAILQQRGDSVKPHLRIHIDTNAKTVSFTDNCGGMSPAELCELLSEVGRSKKKAVPWANGQFGFGVHAFRAFARQATFISRKKGYPEAQLTIDRTFDENKEVACETTDNKQFDRPGTRVTISRFDSQVFRKSVFMKQLVSEIQHHFDDVLRSGFISFRLVKIGLNLMTASILILTTCLAPL
jgi:HSP90 family molecular chaperone